MSRGRSKRGGRLHKEMAQRLAHVTKIGKELGKCLTLNAAGLTCIEIVEYKRWFKEFNVVAMQETNGEQGQEAFLAQRLGFNLGAFSFKSKAKAGVGLLYCGRIT